MPNYYDNRITTSPISFYLFLFLTFVLMGRPQDVFPFLVPLRLALLFTIISLLATFIGNNGLSLNERLGLRESKKYALFYLTMILGIPFAYHRGVAFNYVFLIYSSNMLYFYLFIVHVDSLKRLKSIIFTLCLSTLFISAFSLTKGSLSYGRFSSGTMYDPNDLAYFLVSLFPLSIFFVVAGDSILKKIIGAITIAIAISTIMLTASRGGILGLIAVFMIFLFTKRGAITWSYKILLLIALVTIITFNIDKINIERYMTLTEVGSDYNLSDEFGRYHIWKRAANFFLSNPITGVGVDCFSMAIGYSREAEGLIPKWQPTHNAYVQVAAEIGLIGFAIFISIIICSLKKFSYCRKVEMPVAEMHEVRTIAGLLEVAFIGHLTAAFFLTQAYSILFTLFFAFSAALSRLEQSLHSDNATYMRF